MPPRPSKKDEPLSRVEKKEEYPMGMRGINPETGEQYGHLLNWCGDWDFDKLYRKYDAVRYEGAEYFYNCEIPGREYYPHESCLWTRF